MIRTPIASSLLRDANDTLEVSLYAPVASTPDLWFVEVELKHNGSIHLERVYAPDSFGCLLNGFRFIHKTLNSEDSAWARFEVEGSGWHWFPRIPPLFSREFDSLCSQTIDACHAWYCRNSKRIDDQPSGARKLDGRDQRGRG